MTRSSGWKKLCPVSSNDSVLSSTATFAPTDEMAALSVDP